MFISLTAAAAGSLKLHALMLTVNTAGNIKSNLSNSQDDAE